MLEENWEKKSKLKQKVYKNWLTKVNPKKLYAINDDINEEVFSKIDCLQCAQCCKSYSPRFKMPDIKRISKYLNFKESDFIKTYLMMDKEGDYVLQKQPCSFLSEDNTCSIYDFRPSDCARFPYINEDILIKRPNITLKNSEFCPATYLALEMMMEKIK